METLIIVLLILSIVFAIWVWVLLLRRVDTSSDYVFDHLLVYTGGDEVEEVSVGPLGWDHDRVLRDGLCFVRNKGEGLDEAVLAEVLKDWSRRIDMRDDTFVGDCRFVMKCKDAGVLMVITTDSDKAEQLGNRRLIIAF